MKKNITFFKTALSIGGAERQMLILAGFLADRGYNIQIATFADVPDHYDCDSRFKRFKIAPGKSKKLKLLAIWKFFMSIKTDIVFTFGVRESFLTLPALILRPDVKVICGERNASLVAPPFFERNCHKYLYWRANKIIPNSYTQKQYLSKKFPRLAKKITTITNYTDLTKFTATPLPNNFKILIGVFCRYDIQKNYKRFAEVIIKLKEKFGTTFLVKWFGSFSLHDGIKPQYIDFKHIIEENNISDVIELNDEVKNVEERVPLFDVLCLPSLYEGFSNSLSEYICCGRPVIASDVSDNHVMIHDGENGFLFDPYNVDNMVAAFSKYFALSRDEKDVMGRKSRLLAEQLFDKEEFINSYINIIESL